MSFPLSPENLGALNRVQARIAPGIKMSLRPVGPSGGDFRGAHANAVSSAQRVRRVSGAAPMPEPRVPFNMIHEPRVKRLGYGKVASLQ